MVIHDVRLPIFPIVITHAAFGCFEHEVSHDGFTGTRCASMASIAKWAIHPLFLESWWRGWESTGVHCHLRFLMFC